MTTVELVGLRKEYEGGAPAVRDLTLTIQDGELMVLLGPSGCGKTTTLRMIAGLTAPSAGDLRFDGVSMLGAPPEKRGAAMVFQQHALFPFMSVGDNVAFGLRLRKLNRTAVRRRVAEALAAVQLPGFEDRWPDELSGGQQQRVALARVLAIRPKVLLLDEPLSNLDRSLRVELREMIRDLQRVTGVTTLFVTHDQTEAIAIADRMALMLDGRLHQVGTSKTFFESPADAQVARFFGNVNFIPGVKEGSVVRTALGPLEVSDVGKPDGRVLLTIRPEAVQIGANGHNNLPATVRGYQYQGTNARCLAAVGDVALQVITQPFRTYHENEPIIVHLPKERIRLLPLGEIKEDGGGFNSFGTHPISFKDDCI